MEYEIIYMCTRLWIRARTLAIGLAQELHNVDRPSYMNRSTRQNRTQKTNIPREISNQ